MSAKRNQWLSYLLSGTLGVLGAYSINQIPGLKDLISQGSQRERAWFILMFVVAVAIAVVALVAQQHFGTEPAPSEDLRHKFWKENQNIIKQRLKGSLYQYEKINIDAVDSPQHLGVSQAAPASVQSKNSETKSLFEKGLEGLRESFIFARRELENLRTGHTKPLEASKKISEVFEEANRRLLILGEPGSGKTTELLKLAKELGKRAEKNNEEPIPVIFELSAWRGEPMLDWMVEQMAARYGLNLQICREWLEGDKIVPLLDGLDELGQGENGIEDAIRVIEVLQESYGEQLEAIAICCRIEDYENAVAESTAGKNSADLAQSPIRFRQIDRAVRLKELTDSQIEDYLRKRKAVELWQQLQSRPGFMELARSPMLLNLMPIAYPDGLPQYPPQDREACQKQLFEEFLHRKLDPTKWNRDGKLKDCDHKKARHYLAWLAASMERDEIKQLEFLIEGLQPTWLENEKQRRQYNLISALIWLIFSLFFGFVYRLILALIFRIILGLINKSNSIQLTEAIELSWQKIKRGLSSGLHYAVIGGLIGAVIGLLIGGLIVWVVAGLSVKLIELMVGGMINLMMGGLILGLIGGTIKGLLEGLKADLKFRKKPNQGIWLACINTSISQRLGTYS